MTKTIDFAPKQYEQKLRRELLVSLYRLVALVESSNFYSLYNNILNLIGMVESEQIVDFIADRAGIGDIDLLIEKLQQQTELQLSYKCVLFIMFSPLEYIAEQLDTDEETAAWLYDQLHLRLISDNLIGWMKVILLDAEQRDSATNINKL